MTLETLETLGGSPSMRKGVTHVRHEAWQSMILRMLFSRVTSPTQVLSLPFLREIPAHGGSLIPRVPLPPGRADRHSLRKPATRRCGASRMNCLSSTRVIPQDPRRAHNLLIALDISLYWASHWKETRRHIALCASRGKRRGLLG
jgi:hypothetical protein